MKTTLSSSSSGFTLIEVLVAMALILVSMMGLLQVAGVAATSNMKNLLRDEAVLLGEDQMSELMRLPETTLPGSETLTVVGRTRGAGLSYQVDRSASRIPATSSYRLTVNVSWKYKGVPYRHEVQAMRSFIDGK